MSRRRTGPASIAVLALVTLLAAGCRGALDPEGPQAERIADLWWIMLALSTVIFLLVMGVLAWALIRKPGVSDRVDRDRKVIIGGGGLVLPAVVLFSLLGLTIDALHDLTDPAPPDALEIEITGRNWWWDVVYPESGVRTANEIHIPVGRTVAITGTAADVIHSFWAPELSGKFDFIPGKVSELKLRADEPGVYRGQCAEFCGIAHAKMAFHLVAEPQEDFDAWLQDQQQVDATPSQPLAQTGRDVFFGQGCASCHGLTGERGGNVAAPDLGNFASREWFAAGTRRVNADNLSAWIRNPDSIKPGANMPAFGEQLSSRDLEALVAFLLSLE